MTNKRAAWRYRLTRSIRRGGVGVGLRAIRLPTLVLVIVLCVIGAGLILNAYLDWRFTRRVEVLAQKTAALEETLKDASLDQLKVLVLCKRDLNLTREVLVAKDRFALLEAELIRSGRIRGDYVEKGFHQQRGGIGGRIAHED